MRNPTHRSHRAGRGALPGVLVLVLGVSAAWGQEYLIRQPTEPSSQPVHLTQPVEGAVEVTNLPPVQDVRVTGGTLDGPVTVQGTVEVRASTPLPVEVTNPAPTPAGPVEVEGTVTVDDRVPVRVVVTNPPSPPPAKPEERFAVFSFRGVFGGNRGVVRETFSPPEGMVFRATGVTLDCRADAFLRLRLLADARAVVGQVVGGGPVPLFLLDSRVAPTASLGRPVPLRGPFVVEVEAPKGLGAPFTAVVTGYLSAR
ncbi:hypothetical protein [Deferrisoma camini]|uniref:hypothetical protein n=1 Tax=Deferrisoma camini TaxID=1035120 RepID=UPI00146D0002|nr:hypothetical protein [Deferrisoma camini]